jgi:hypothetical protein
MDGVAWVVLSVKYGFIAPHFLIKESYEVSFKYPDTDPIAFGRLRQQVRDQQLDRYSIIVGLGGKEYREAVEAAFADLPVIWSFPSRSCRWVRACRQRSRQ